MRSTLVSLLIVSFLSSFVWAQPTEVTFDFEHLLVGDVPHEGVVIARMLDGTLIEPYDPGVPPSDPHIAIRVSRAFSGAGGFFPPLRVDQLAFAPGRPPEWGVKTLSPFADPTFSTKLVIDILHVPNGMGVGMIRWEMGDAIPSDDDEYTFQTFVDTTNLGPADPELPPAGPGGSWNFTFTRGIDVSPGLPPEQEFFAVTEVTERSYAITKFEVWGGSQDYAPVFLHSIYYDNFTFGLKDVADPGTNALVEGTDVPGSDFGGDFVSYGGDSGEDPFVNSPPTVNPTGGGVVECGSVVLGGSVSDLDGGDLAYEWVLIGSVDNELLGSGTVTVLPDGATTPLPDLPLAPSVLCLGVHTIELRVVDVYLAEVVVSMEVEVVDTTPPTIAPVSSHCQLWPPNHKMVAVTIQANATDNCCGTPTLSVDVHSNEPVDDTGDGKFAPDWDNLVVDQNTGTITLELRAERSGNGDGRTYTVEITATDCSDNSSITNVTVSVPHNFKNKKKAKKKK